jgi:hypothetical protein
VRKSNGGELQSPKVRVDRVGNHGHKQQKFDANSPSFRMRSRIAKYESTNCGSR